MRSIVAKTCAFCAVWAVLLSLDSQVQAQVTCIQNGSELSISGSDFDDFVDLDCFFDVVFVSGYGEFYGVSKVSVATGDGSDQVTVIAFLLAPGMEFDFDTGNDSDSMFFATFESETPLVAIRTGSGDDEVFLGCDYAGFDMTLDTGSGNDGVTGYFSGLFDLSLSVFAGNGEDRVWLDGWGSNGDILVDTGNGNDYAFLSVNLLGADSQVEMQLGNGDDRAVIRSPGAPGVFDGGNGEDGKFFYGNTNNTEFINFEFEID